MTSVPMEWESRLGRRLRVRDLYVLSTVVKSGGIGRAARQLAMTQPAVSAAIANLEHMLGVRLLDRSPRGIEPTIYAHAMLKRSIAVSQPLVGLRELIVRHPEFRIEQRGLPSALDCRHVVASCEGDLRGERVMNEIKRVQFAGAPHRHERIFVSAQRRKDDSKHPVRQTRTGIERDGSAAGGFRSRPVPVKPEFHDA